VLHANNAALGYIADIQEALEGRKPVTAADVCRLVAGVTVQTYRMVANLMRMTGRQYRALPLRFKILKNEISRKVELTPALKQVGFVVPLGEVSPCVAAAVGHKSAYLGEARRILKDRVPDGFAITVAAYRAFMEADGLGSRVASALGSVEAGDVVSCFEASARIVQMIETTRVPEEVAGAIRSAVDRLPGGPHLRLAVRSSAIQEGGAEMSFAGQYRSLLNITPDGTVDAFRRVIASKYSPEAITYRIGRGFEDAEVAMCCCVVTMVDPAAAGVLYTSYPTSSGNKTVLQAVRGLGLAAVDGSTEPTTLTLDRSSRTVLDIRPGIQKYLLRSAASEGTEKVILKREDRQSPALNPPQALVVADLAWQLEASLGMPLDVEWAMDCDGHPFILQLRVLADSGSGEGVAAKPRVPGAEILIQAGTRASGGVGSGPVYYVESDLDILRCPRGSVVVTSEANPRFAVLLPRIAAIVADMGEVTGHLATVARELHVPALFATREATERMRPGEIVTVDADARVVYSGQVDVPRIAAEPVAGSTPPNPNREILQSVANLIIPLTLRDRLASGYSPGKCRTIHDIIRFCHQATIEAMFDLGDKTLRKGGALRRLVSPVPIDCRVFDFGGGVDPGATGDRLMPEDIICRPMRVLWKGMLDPRIRWRHARPISVRGFMSALVDYNFDLDARLRPMGEPSYAFITSEYLNLNSRIGYHFSTVDARVGDAVESNYASFRFVGGSTGIEQRSRRARLIQRLLDAHGFETDCRADLVNARIRHRPAEEIDEALLLVGLLMGYVNHLDMALVSDSVMKLYEDAFMAGDYGFKGE
jgi:pyruvate,water dikinase